MTKAPTKIQQNAIAGLAIAACAMALSAGGELQLLPAGAFSARDGRPTDAPGWNLDAALAAVLIAAAAARGTPYVIDYEHQTLLAKENGKPAPAAGWFSKLEWREGAGLFAVDVEWTVAALAMIEAKEYRFSSPVIGYDKATGNVNALYMAAITNNPAIDGMNEALLTAAALKFSFSPHTTPLTQEIPMELLEQLRWMLNLPISATEAEITAELQKIINQIKQADPAATAAASFDLAAHLVAQRTSIATLTAAVATPDPAKFVPIAAVQALQTQVAQLTAATNTNNLTNVTSVVAAAVASGKLIPALVGWATDLGKKDFAALSAFISTAPTMIQLDGTQSDGKPPESSALTALTANQVALCSAMGVSEEDFLKTLQEEQTA